MKELFDTIVENTKIIADAQEHFCLPSTGDLPVIKDDYASGGHTLYGKKYTIGDESEKIVVTYESKDKCRTFQVKPDMNIVTVTWSKKGETDHTFTESWEDKF